MRDQKIYLTPNLTILFGVYLLNPQDVNDHLAWLGRRPTGGSYTFTKISTIVQQLQNVPPDPPPPAYNDFADFHLNFLPNSALTLWLAFNGGYKTPAGEGLRQPHVMRSVDEGSRGTTERALTRRRCVSSPSNATGRRTACSRAS
jgi:hypothetical protein